MLRRPLLLSLLLCAGLVGSVAVDGWRSDPAEAATAAGVGVGVGVAQGAGRYLGRWNYDQPDRATMRNVAVITCPAAKPGCPGSAPVNGTAFSIEVPQIGDIVLRREAGGVVGRTDQGCTWRFVVRPGSLELAEPQTCFNQVIGSSYTITRWSITVSGRHATETVAALSHQPTGDCDFLLQHGSRTRTDDRDGRDITRRFAGTWAYDAADPRSRVNMLFSQCTLPDGGTEQRQAPRTGQVTFVRGRHHTITAVTDDGCRWTLAVRGNTALLEPAVQTCRLAEATVTLKHWSIASDGRQQASVMSGVETRGATTCNFLLSVGSLTRR